MVPTKVSHYEITERISAGKEEKLYVAVDLKQNNRVLLKMFHGSASLARENADRLQSRLTFPFENEILLSVNDVGQWRNQMFAVCQYVEGKTLATFSNDASFGPDDVVDIGIQIARALAAIHQAGVHHYGIRAENILITPDRQVKLLDVGWINPSRKQTAVAKHRNLLKHKDRDVSKKKQGREGSPDSSTNPDAPLEGERADLLSLGALLYQMASGGLSRETEPPVLTAEQILKNRQSTVGVLNPSIPAAFGKILDGLLEKDPKTRIGTADELLARLDAIESKEKQIPASGAIEPGAAMALTPRPKPSGALGTEHRYVNTWFEWEEKPQLPPLVVRRSYAFKLNIGSRRNDSSAHSAEFAGADFGGRESISLLVSLFGNDFEVENRRLPLELGRAGDSAVVETTVKPLSAKKCKLAIVISLAVELEIIQTCEVEVAAIEEAAPKTLRASAAS
jgi:serine/threonine protein kinase